MSALANVVAFDLTERDRRWERVRSAMAEHGIDLLIALPESDADDVRYLAQEGGAVLFPLEGDPWILIGGEDSNLAVARKGWIDQRSSVGNAGVNRVSYGAAVADKLRELKLTPRRVGIAGLDGSTYSHVRALDGYVLYATVSRIREALPGIEVVNGAPVVGSARYVKSEAEIEATLVGVRAAEAAAAAIGRAYRVGTTQADAFRAGYAEVFQPGISGAQGSAVPNIAWCPGQWGQHRPRILNAPPGVIEEGLCLTVEVFTSVGGCFAQVAESYVAGPLLPEQQEAFELNVAAFEAARLAMRPGGTWREVKEASVAVADGTGWAVTFLLHGGAHGPMFIPHDRHEDWLDDKLQANTTHICKPHVFPASQGDEVARSHELTWGDMLVVREGGAVRLGTRPQRLGAAG